MKKFTLLPFKTIDDKFADIGFKKIEETTFYVTYERVNHKYNYTQKLVLSRKVNGRHLIQSYDPNLFDDKFTGNIGVGLTMYEAKLCVKKMKQKGWKMKKYFD